MSIAIDQVRSAAGTARASQAGIAWSLWPTSDITAAPGESGTGLTTGADGSLTVPSTASAGILMLRISDTDMGLYQF